MKRNITVLVFALLSAMAVHAVSVNDVAGQFKGSLYIGGTEYAGKNVFILPGTESNKITFVLPEFKYNTALLGDIVLVNISMYSNGQLSLDKSTLYIKAIAERATISVLNNYKEGSETYNSVVSSGSAQILLSIAAPSLPEPILVLFDGKKVTNENYAITNGGFEGTWSNGEPSGWHSFNSATGDYVSFVKNTDQFKQSSDIRPGSSGTHSAMLETKMVAGAKANGSCTNGQLNAGSMTATDASGNYGFSDPSNSGYNTSFVGNPDSLVFWAKYIPADKNPSNSVNKARAHAVVTTNARYQDPEAKSYASVKIAEAAINYSATSSMGWQRIAVPFTYSSVNPSNAAYMLITFTTNYEPGGGSSYSEGSLFNKTYYYDNIYLDDVEMVYNHSLVSLTMNGNPVSFTNGQATSSQIFSDSKYDFVAVSNGKASKSFIGYDAGSNRVYVYVVANNYSQAKAYSVYTLQMAKPKVDTEFAYSATTCSNEPYSDNLFSNLSESGVYTKTIPNKQGGDSVVTLTLTVNPSYSIEKVVYVNEADLDWRGKHIQGLPVSAEPYMYYDSLLSVKGCDSVFILKLYVSDIPVTYGAYQATVCDGEHIMYDNVRYDGAFDDDVHFSKPNSFGGDSVVHLVITVLPSYTISESMTITVGEQKTWEGIDLSTMPVGDITLDATYYTIDDCDSTLVLHLKVLPEHVASGVGQTQAAQRHIQKVIYNGRLYIIREDETIYDILGTKIK